MPLVGADPAPGEFPYNFEKEIIKTGNRHAVDE